MEQTINDIVREVVEGILGEKCVPAINGSGRIAIRDTRNVIWRSALLVNS
jgi:hypothetical protein